MSITICRLVSLNASIDIDLLLIGEDKRNRLRQQRPTAVAEFASMFITAAERKLKAVTTSYHRRHDVPQVVRDCNGERVNELLSSGAADRMMQTRSHE